MLAPVAKVLWALDTPEATWIAPGDNWLTSTELTLAILACIDDIVEEATGRRVFAELAMPEIDVCRETKLLDSPLLVVVVPAKLDKAVDMLDTSDAIVEA